MTFTENEIARFQKKYIPVSCGCWLWNSHLTKTGYGKFRIGWKPTKAVNAHRASWEIHKGPIPSGLHVLHRCDIPSCINPEHLFLGTPAINTADRIAKGRSLNPPTGTAHFRAKLTPEIAAIIRSQFTGKHGEVSMLARKYGVARSSIYHVLKGLTWKL